MLLIRKNIANNFDEIKELTNGEIVFDKNQENMQKAKQYLIELISAKHYAQAANCKLLNRISGYQYDTVKLQERTTASQFFFQIFSGFFLDFFQKDPFLDPFYKPLYFKPV